MQPGFSMGCSGHLLPKPEGLESERHKGEAFGSGWLQTGPLGDSPIFWKLSWLNFHQPVNSMSMTKLLM